MKMSYKLVCISRTLVYLLVSILNKQISLNIILLKVFFKTRVVWFQTLFLLCIESKIFPIQLKLAHPVN